KPAALIWIEVLVGEVSFELFDQLAVKHRLLLGQRATRAHLGLVREIRDNAAIGLQTPQQVRLNQAPQWRVAMGVIRRTKQLGDAREISRFAKQAGIEEIEEAPQVTEAILNRCTGECDARSRLQLLYAPRLGGAWVLDGLRFVEHREVP